MITRTDYVIGCKSNEAGTKLHQDYYGQFVDDFVKDLVQVAFRVKMLKEAYKRDEHFNTIPLSEWDVLATALKINPAIPKKLKEYGDFWSLAGGVCILKEAARQLVTENGETDGQSN